MESSKVSPRTTSNVYEKGSIEKIEGHKRSTYSVLKLHQIEKEKERGHVCKWPFHEFKKSQKKATKQCPYLIKGKIVK